MPCSTVRPPDGWVRWQWSWAPPCSPVTFKPPRTCCLPRAFMPSIARDKVAHSSSASKEWGGASGPRFNPSSLGGSSFTSQRCDEVEGTPHSGPSPACLDGPSGPGNPRPAAWQSGWEGSCWEWAWRPSRSCRWAFTCRAARSGRIGPRASPRCSTSPGLGFSIPHAPPCPTCMAASDVGSRTWPGRSGYTT